MASGTWQSRRDVERSARAPRASRRHGRGLALRRALDRHERARAGLGDHRGLAPVRGGLRGRLGSGLPADAPHVRRLRRRLAGDVLAAAGRLRVQGRAERLLGRELRPERAGERREHPAPACRTDEREVLLRQREPLGHRQRRLDDRGGRGRLPVRARLSGRLAARLPPLVARGPGRRRHVHVRDHRAPGRVVRGEGGAERELGRQLRRGRRARRREHLVQRPRSEHEGHVQLELDDARARDRRPRRHGRPVPLRPRPQGLPRHCAQHDVEGLVHGRGRRPQRRLLPDDRQHERRDAPVHGHRRVDVHGSPGARHDLLGRGAARQRRHGLSRDDHREEREVHDRDPVRHRSGAKHRAHAREALPRGRRLPPVRPLRPDRERQRRGWDGERRRRLRDGRHLGGPPGARLLRHRDLDERGEPRLRTAGLRRGRRGAERGDERARGRAERRPRAARRVARDRRPVSGRVGRQRGSDRTHRAHGRRRRARARVRRHAGRGGCHGGRLARLQLREDARGVPEGLEGLRQRARQAARGEAARHRRQGSEAARRHVLPQRERAQGVRGQDLRGRDRREPRVALGAGRVRGRPCEHVLRVLPRGVRAGPLRGLDRTGRRRRSRDRARGDAVPVPAAAAARRLDAPQQPRERQGRARLVRHAARRDRVSDHDGRPARPHRRHALRRPRQAGGELRRGPRARVRRGALGRAVRLLAVDDRRGDRGSRRCRRPRARERRHCVRLRLARDRGRLAALGEGMDRDDERRARVALLHPALEDRRPERGDHVQRRERRPDARPAVGRRRRLPRARATRRAVGQRPRRARVAAGRRRDHPLDDAQRPRLAPLQR